MVANAKSAPALAVIRSLGKKNIEVTGVTDSKNDFPIYSKYCRHKIFLRTDPEDFEGRLDELLEIVRERHYDVFLPVMNENILLVLSRRKDEFEKYTKLPLAAFDQLNIFMDKAATAKLLWSNQIPGPKTFLMDAGNSLDAVLREAAFPVVIKPCRGEGAEGVSIITDPADLPVRYHRHLKTYGPSLIQEFVRGAKHTAVFLVNINSEPRRFFVHRAIREFPITGGPTCFLESVRYDPIFEHGLKLIKAINYSGLASMEFIIDEQDGKPKIIDINPRFYGPLQGAISAGVDFPYALFKMAVEGDIEEDFSYRTGVKCRHLLFGDTRHLISVLKGAKSPKYKAGKVRTLLNYLKFGRDDSYFILSKSDPRPALKMISGFLKLPKKASIYFKRNY